MSRIKDIELSTRLRNFLSQLGIQTVEELQKIPVGEFDKEKYYRGPYNLGRETKSELIKLINGGSSDTDPDENKFKVIDIKNNQIVQSFDTEKQAQEFIDDYKDDMAIDDDGDGEWVDLGENLKLVKPIGYNKNNVMGIDDILNNITEVIDGGYRFNSSDTGGILFDTEFGKLPFSFDKNTVYVACVNEEEADNLMGLINNSLGDVIMASLPSNGDRSIVLVQDAEAYNTVHESKNSNKIKIKESELRSLIKNTIVKVIKEDVFNDAGEPMMTHSQYRDYSEPSEPDEYDDNNSWYEEEYTPKSIVKLIQNEFNTHLENFGGYQYFFPTNSNLDIALFFNKNNAVRGQIYNGNNNSEINFPPTYLEDLDIDRLVEFFKPYKEYILTGEELDDYLNAATRDRNADDAYDRQERSFTGG